MGGAECETNRIDLLLTLVMGCWRPSPPLPNLTRAQLTTIVPLLLQTNLAALGWWVVQHSDRYAPPDVTKLHHAYYRDALHATINERALCVAVSLLRGAGIEPLVAKGWAAARLYPTPGLRPYGDIDLCVRPAEYSTALGILQSPAASGTGVDLHPGFPSLDDRAFDLLDGQAIDARLGDTRIRVLGPEDHLRLLCLHFVHHGAARPLWLCDIAAAIEAQTEEFDWNYCLAGDARRRDWVIAVLGLARDLLGAKLEGTPLGAPNEEVPPWLVSTVPHLWEAKPPHAAGPDDRFVEQIRRHPGRIVELLRERQTNPIAFAYHTGRSCATPPPSSALLLDFLIRGARSLWGSATHARPSV